MRLARLVLLILASLAVAFILSRTLFVSAQSNCQQPPLTGLGGWAQGTTVNYQVSSNANTSEASQISQAFASWAGANKVDGSNVSFNNMGSNAGPAQITVTLCNTTGCAGGNPSEVAISPPSGNPVTGANITIDTTKVPDSDNDILRVALHEIGHTMGLDEEPGANGQPNCGQIPGGSVMNSECGTSFTNIPTSPTSCDQNAVFAEPAYSPPPSNSCNSDSDCPTSYTCGKGTCVYNPTGGDGGGGGLQCTPIVLAVGSTPDYDLTSIQGGVWFDVTGTGVKQLVAWTQAGQPVGFLVLDRNQNGIIDNRSEMFGNHTLLPNGQLAANGYEALAAYDQPQNGGNGNGVIDAGDAIWSKLALWIDWNHNGVSEPSEIYSLDDLGITQLSLRYEITNRTDQFGNAFRLQAPFTVEGKVRMGYDVFFVW